MGEGLVTLDHTRAAVALELGIGSIPVRAHGIDESLPSSMTGRFGDSIIWERRLPIDQRIKILNYLHWVLQHP